MCTFLNDYRAGLEIQYIPRQETQIFFGNTTRLPVEGDKIESRGTNKTYEVVRVQQMAGRTYQGQCIERKD